MDNAISHADLARSLRLASRNDAVKDLPLLRDLLIQAADALGSGRVAVEREQVFAWLVEKQNDGAVWLTANGQWTRDANEALWFMRKIDAELFTFNLGDNASAIEHCFIGSSIAAAKRSSGSADRGRGR